MGDRADELAVLDYRAARESLDDAARLGKERFVRHTNGEGLGFALTVDIFDFNFILSDLLAIGGTADICLALRLSHAKRLLKYSTLNVTEISFAVGFSDANYFSNVFKRREGLSPLAYRRQGKTR